MDPDEALSEIRELISQDYTAELGRDDVAALIGRVEALDQWLTRGGFLPGAWSHGPEVRRATARVTKAAEREKPAEPPLNDPWASSASSGGAPF